MKCKDPSFELLSNLLLFFKGINELAGGLGSASLLSRIKKEAAADEAKEKLKEVLRQAQDDIMIREDDGLVGWDLLNGKCGVNEEIASARSNPASK